LFLIYPVACDIRQNLILLISTLIVFVVGHSGLSLAEEEIVVIDATGHKLFLKRAPRRIVSLNPDFTENIFALGAGDLLVGATDFCRLPEDHAGLRRIGGLWQPNLEQIIALRPDLVLATREGNNPGTITALRELGVTVFVMGQPTGFKDYLQFLRKLGRILDREKEAGRLIDEFTILIGQLRAGVDRRSQVTVFLQIGVRPLVTANKDTLIDEMIEIGGGKNIASELSPRYPALSREQVLVDDPDVIIIAAMGSEAQRSLEVWKAFPELKAVRKNRVFLLDPDLICRLGPRLKDGLRHVASFINFDK